MRLSDGQDRAIVSVKEHSTCSQAYVPSLLKLGLIMYDSEHVCFKLTPSGMEEYRRISSAQSSIVEIQRETDMFS